MSIKKCISCEYAVIQKNYDRITKSVIACRQHHDIFAPECEYNTSNTLNALDCVERQAAIDALSTPHGILYPIRTIEELPSAERRGKWIYKSELGWGETWVCSECGEKTTSTVMGKPRWDYCPNCGARMEED